MTGQLYLDRLMCLNEGADLRSVWDSIDRPIRPLVYELNRIGIPTVFSCCGFHYDGEEESKSHAVRPYVQLQCPETSRQAKQLIVLGKKTAYSEWLLYPSHPKIWMLVMHGHIIDRQHRYWSGNDIAAQAFELDTPIHGYEFQVLAIHHLTQQLQGVTTVDPDFVITDGNQRYIDWGIEEWQVKPKRSTCGTDIDAKGLSVERSLAKRRRR